MRLLSSLALSALSFTSACLAASWGFEDATLTVQGKGAGVGGGVKEKLTPNSPLTSYAVTLPSTDTLKIILTATEGKTGKRPHQAFLTLHDPTTGLEESFPFSLKENGKGKVEVTHKDLPHQLLTSPRPLKASLTLASFGAATAPYTAHAFDLALQPDTANTPPAPPTAERYTPKPEIHHLFKPSPSSPPRIISAFFAVAVLATLPLLFGAWALLGGNLSHANKAFGSAPVAHALFLGSVVAMEGVFVMYYTRWNLFQMLPVALVVGGVAFVSGSRALTEVQERRLAGER
ncbi:hypothetical protein LTR53_004392 [Teratosphaeriaceae sp. CCFEE 6253]|nr:hypothetical protein LTR53_004392 [Teratosphaeriaceae sp. CCFEE 6253]